ncbi:MAG TPA: hypothetical protein VK035_08285 [Kiloniellales bacterium]|nr:hypothetical protein [Kiloniellales bacterium]
MTRNLCHGRPAGQQAPDNGERRQKATTGDAQRGDLRHTTTSGIVRHSNGIVLWT